MKIQESHEQKKNLTEALKANQDLLFYKIMWYPVPINYQNFLIDPKRKQPKKQQETKLKEDKINFSRKKENPYLKDFFDEINKHKKLFKSLPFIKSIYLCNSITFNALKEDSDIDLFIVTEPWAMRRARFFSVLFFSILGLKRSLKRSSKKFCLTFYVTQNAQNLYNISLPQVDIYLIHRLAHLVPIYHEDYKNNNNNNIYKHNKRQNNFMPNFPNKQLISLKYNKLYTWKSFLKKTIEFFLKKRRWRIIESLIKHIRSPIVIRKTKQHKKGGWGIVISDSMLKFHKDKRKKIHLKYTINKRQ